jgi:uncharacterized membrane protein YeaQ/YmgE (transglycosylase-associated protein family)
MRKKMGLLAWIILLVMSAALATVAQYLFFRNDRNAQGAPADYDWVYIAGGALLGGFTAHAWYPVGPTANGLYIVPALAGALVLGVVAELVYRFYLRPRWTA